MAVQSIARGVDIVRLEHDSSPFQTKKIDFHVDTHKRTFALQFAPVLLKYLAVAIVHNITAEFQLPLK